MPLCLQWHTPRSKHKTPTYKPITACSLALNVVSSLLADYNFALIFFILWPCFPLRMRHLKFSFCFPLPVGNTHMLVPKPREPDLAHIHGRKNRSAGMLRVSGVRHKSCPVTEKSPTGTVHVQQSPGFRHTARHKSCG